MSMRNLATPRHILFLITILAVCLFSHQVAAAVSIYSKYKIQIKLANGHSQHYCAGEKAVFVVETKEGVLRCGPRWTLQYVYVPCDIPSQNLQIKFFGPNTSIPVQLKKIDVGKYECETPVLTKAGTYTLTAGIILRSWLGFQLTLARGYFVIEVHNPPAIHITDPINNSVTNRSTITVQGTATNANTVKVNGANAVINAGRFTAQNIRLTEGSNTITAVATNQWANAQDSVTVTLDTIPPTNPTAGIEEGIRVDNRLIHLILSAGDANEVEISENENFTGAVWVPYAERKEYTLSQGDGLKNVYVKYRDRAGNETEVLTTKILLGHIITITSPTDGQTINASYVTVTGNINGSAEGVKVYIDGLPAKTVNNTFCLNQFSLVVGTNTITVQTYLNSTLLEQTSINVTIQQLNDPIQIAASPLSGEPNLVVNFTVTTNIQNPIVKYEWDFDNDGVYDAQSQTSPNTSHTYTAVRIYHPTIKVTDNNQIQYSAEIPINVYLTRQAQWEKDIQDPIDIAVDSQRNLYVLQKTNAQIKKYDKDGNILDTIGLEGQLAGQFDHPCGIAIDQTGNIYIADTGNNRIQKLTSLGLPDETFGTGGVVGINADNDSNGTLDSGTQDSQFNQPYSIAVDGEGNIYVSDTRNNRIQKFSQTGQFILSWINQSPYGIAVDTFGDVYVASKDTNQIQIYTSTGSTEGTYTQVNSPTDIAISNNYIYIADTGNNKIQKIDKQTLQFISAVDSFNNGSTRENITNPVAIALDTDLQKEMIYAIDRMHGKIIKIELPAVSPSQAIDAMKQGLASGNITNALNSFTEESKQKYQEIFNLIRSDLPEAVNNMNDIHPITIQDNYAEYIVVRQENGEEHGYFITFVKDENGEWKIQDM